MILQLHPGVIHLYMTFPDEINDPKLLAEYESLLNADEKKRLLRFHFAKHRRHYLVTRALTRRTLSRYINKDPRDWCFSLNQYGRPEIIRAAHDPDIRFNISHTDGLIMVGFVLHDDIGVDVENTQRKSAALEIADRFFSRREVKDLKRLPRNEQKQRFFDYWTLKEAYIKARGMGLSLPLDQFSFHLDATEDVRISFAPGMRDNPEHWRFWQLKPSAQHLAAVAVKSAANRQYRLITKTVVPLKK